MAFTKQQEKAALHTLWQAAVASGGVGEIAKSITDHSVNLPGVEQGGIVAGVAVAGAALSVVKSMVANYLVAHKNDKAVQDEVKLAKLAGQIATYQAQHSATAAVPVAAV